MTLLPIVERELRVAARQRGTFWLRGLVAFGVIVVATWIFLVAANESQRELGKVIFYALTGGMMLYCLLAGVRATADCLSEEKREGTLGLLFLTDLRGYDVVFGKLVANSLAVFYGVLAVVPVLAIPLLMGGVSGGEFGRVALVLVNTLFFSLSAGMLASAVCQNHRAAVGLTLLFILLFVAGGPLLGLWLAWKQNWGGKYEFAFLFSSPVYSYFAAFDKMLPRGAGNGFYWSVGIGHGLGWALLALASWLVPRSWQDKAAVDGGWRGRTRAWLEGDAATRREFRARLLDRNAFFWLATRPRLRTVWAWIPLALAVGIWGWGLYQLGRDWLDIGIYIATAILLSTTMKGWIGAEAGRRLIQDRKSGALELLLSTPLSVPDIMRGQRLALQRQFLRPVLVLLGASGLMAFAGANSSTLNGGDRPYWYWGWVAGLVMFGADVVALYWLGMWTGLAVRNSRHAFGAAIAPVLGLPWIAIAFVLTVINLLPREAQRLFNWDGWPVLLWFGFGILADVGFGFWARHKLLTEFRALAAQRYQPKPSWWRQLFGKSSA
jgi:ABC-type transport system involved in cytochrome c biogenesis permease component